MLPRSSGLRPRTDSPNSRPLGTAAVPSLPPLPPGKRKTQPAKRLSRQKGRALLIGLVVAIVSVLVGVIVISVLNADEPDTIKNEEKYTLEDWKSVLEKKAKQTAPPHEALGLSQIVFVSCNRHDRSQAYWGYVAAAAQCEMVPTDVRAKSPPCRRLYAGRSPIVTTTQRAKAKALHKSLRTNVSSQDTVPLGSCGTVVDSEIALQYRLSSKSQHWQAVMRTAWRVLRRNQIFYPAAHVTAGKSKPAEPLAPPPVDGLVWLGDAIYADKSANGGATQGFGHVSNSLADIRKMWRFQRDSPMYDAFRGSCVRREGAALESASSKTADTDPLNWLLEAVVDVGRRVAELFAVDEDDENGDAVLALAEDDIANQIDGNNDTVRDGGDEHKENPEVPEENRMNEEGVDNANPFGKDDGIHDDVEGNQDGDDDDDDDDGDDDDDDDDGSFENPDGPGLVVELAREVLGNLLNENEDVENLDPEEIAARAHLRGGGGAAEDDADDQLHHDGLMGIWESPEDNEDELNDDMADVVEYVDSAADPHQPQMTRLPTPPTVARPNVFGTWDDHDMGKNDGGKEYPYKNVTQRYFLDFLQAPPNDPRWSHQGVYAFHTMDFHDIFMGDSFSTSAVFGGAAADDGQLSKMHSTVAAALSEVYHHAICLILLDVRSFRDSPTAAHTGDILGEAQWRWLEKRIVEDLHRSPDGREKCAITLVGGGIQLIADEKTAENWAAFPRSRDRLFGLFRAHQIERVAFLTGDVHMGEIAADFTDRTISHVMGYPIVEATSSGLTHSAAIFPGVATLLRMMFTSPQRRIGRIYIEKNFGTVRLSLDGAQTMQQLSDITAILHGIRTADTKDPALVARARCRLRDTLDAIVNATFTVYSIPNKGRPVLRLNFPLSMLTYGGSKRYVDATVTPQRGYVHRSVPIGAVRETGSQDASGSLPPSELVEIETYFPPGKRMVARYPNNKAPIFTAYIRWMQAHFFPTKSISETIGALIRIHINLAIVVVIVLVAYYWRKLRRWTIARKVRKNLFPAAGSTSPSAGSPTQKEETTTAVAFANFVMGKEEKQKEG